MSEQDGRGWGLWLNGLLAEVIMDVKEAARAIDDHGTVDERIEGLKALQRVLRTLDNRLDPIAWRRALEGRAGPPRPRPTVGPGGQNWPLHKDPADGGAA